MNVGFVSTWFERGAAYVTKQYIELLKNHFNIFVYARGGEKYGKNDPNWDFPYVTWSPKLLNSNINFSHFKKWIKRNNIDIIFFNEQKEIDVVVKLKKYFPEIKLGCYIDYYKENTVKEFFLYDFLICNTKRHYSVFKDHPQCYYVPWGTDVDLFKPKENEKSTLTFFHSAGMSNRKGTTFVIDAFKKGELYKESKLIVHIQKDFERNFGYKVKELNKYNIEIIEKTVTAPGLYYLGDVYVYPTKLDGLGLTMYEALSSGLPVIATNHPPMNEVVNNEVGYLIDVENLISRSDGYYWPQSIINIDSLIEGMWYFVNSQSKLKEMQIRARKYAIDKWNWSDRRRKIVNIFQDTKIIVNSPKEEYISKISKMKKLNRKIGSSYLFSIYREIRNYLK